MTSGQMIRTEMRKAEIKATKQQENKRTEISPPSKNSGVAVSHTTQTSIKDPKHTWLVS